MLLYVPYEIETLQQERPWANWLLVAACSIISIAALNDGLSWSTIDAMILDGWAVPGLIGHVFLHGDYIHLIGNMIFLWVFGNAVSTNTSNWLYLPTFFLCALIAAAFHLIIDGAPVIGASGAINGIVGIVFAMYPLNRVHIFYLFIIKGGSFSVRAWVVILFWLAFDLWGALAGGGMVAYWAHIGGFVGGVAIGLTCLQLRWFRITEYDNRSLLEIFKGEFPD